MSSSRTTMRDAPARISTRQRSPPQSVSVATFGKVYTFPVDGQVYAQPLYKSNLTIAGKGTFNVVFVATEHSSVYAFDADAATPIWHRSFINPATGLTTRPTNASLEDINPEVSITSTPVIDPTSNTLYVVAQTVQSGSPAYYWLHALDITTGLDKVTPVQVQASVGSGATPLNVNAATSQQRPGLFLRQRRRLRWRRLKRRQLSLGGVARGLQRHHARSGFRVLHLRGRLRGAREFGRAVRHRRWIRAATSMSQPATALSTPVLTGRTRG